MGLTVKVTNAVGVPVGGSHSTRAEHVRIECGTNRTRAKLNNFQYQGYVGA